ncbi:HAD-superfamily hydrolase, subfamily IA, variant 3 [Thermodesulfatator indicus DSM 15286]|uniref:HAD-superfamily hydrolase, subfamily IA, variant 3 n=1 Tax=Thermodesulfatator indicus (strain DSM 15286 / JCM 11887 / CIR29812) TaxID=667014 RepID=F8ABN0_THEID|nr:HAD family phosphatase [Thermodesulfatator indicus]AEH45631.1 HAD-superfamily hydrolase, subfamily IA, variant 3 [Thermodesulfatator indicus DSM 15286]
METLKDKEAILFDMDGVVLDSMPWHVRAWQEAFREFGLNVPEEALYLHEGAIEAETSRKIFEDQGVSPTRELFEAVLRRQRELFKKKYQAFVKPFPEIPDLLSDLRREGRKLALVTSSHHEILKEILPEKLMKLFHFILTGDKVRRRKPHPEPYLLARKAVGVKAEEASAVENAPAGIKSAKGAGLLCVALTTTLPPEHLREADIILDSHQELFKLVRNGKE